MLIVIRLGSDGDSLRKVRGVDSSNSMATGGDSDCLQSVYQSVLRWKPIHLLISVVLKPVLKN